MKASDFWITCYASIYYFWWQSFVFIQTNYAQINGNGRFGINYPCRCSQLKLSFCTRIIPLATSCQSIDTRVFISLIIFMHIITGIWYKQQEHKQLPPPVLSRDIRRWAPSAVSHCLKVGSETALKLSCVPKIFLSHRPGTRQGTGVQVDHLWSLISTRPDLLMY